MHKNYSSTLLTLVAFFILGFSNLATAKPVSVEVTNAPDVNVANTPDVNVATLPAVDIATMPPVIVGNKPPEQVPFHRGLDEWSHSQVGTAEMLHKVAAGKRMYVEHISLSALYDPSSYVRCWVQVVEDVDENTTILRASHHLAMSTTGPAAPGGAIYITSTPISLAVEAGQWVQGLCNHVGLVYVSGNITGYLIDLPPSRVD